MPETARERVQARYRGHNLEASCAKAMRGVVVGRSKAVKVGAEYVSINLGAPPDVLAPGGFSFECKNKKLPKVVAEAINQAVRNAPEGYSPYVWWYDKKNGTTYVMTTKYVFLDNHGPGGEA